MNIFCELSILSLNISIKAFFLRGIYDKWNSEKSAFFPCHDVKPDYRFGMTCLRSTVAKNMLH